MTEQLYILIPDWSRFQHYKDRTPLWIKTYTELLADDAYLNLTFHQRGILHGLWLEYSRARCQLLDNTVTLTRRLGQRVTRRDLDALNHAGFIEYTLAPGYHDASLEVEVEKKVFKTPSSNPKTAGERFATNVATETHRPYYGSKNPAASIVTMITNGAIPDIFTLNAELDAAGINGTTADELRALIPSEPVAELPALVLAIDEEPGLEEPGLPNPDADIPF